MIRTRFPAAAGPHFRTRATEVSRLEGFTDAAFGFAITLLVVSLEVPKTVDQLLDTMRGWAAFAICFACLLQIWWIHNRFFRRYGLQDTTIFILNSVLIFVVLLYVYPLKFIFSTLLAGLMGGAGIQVSPNQARAVFSIYSGGTAATFLVLALMHLHAWRLRGRLALTAVESAMTVHSAAHDLCIVAFGIASIAIAQLAPLSMIEWAGWIYFGIPIAMTVLGSSFGKRIRLASEAAARDAEQNRIKVTV